MKTLRFIIPAFAIALLPLYACQTEGEEAGSETTAIEEDREPDLIIEEREPDVIVDERKDEGFEADIEVDGDRVRGKVKVDEDEPR